VTEGEKMTCRRVLAVIAALGATSMAGGCAREEEPPVASELLPEGVDVALLKMDTFLTRDGVRRARLKADTAEFTGETETEIHVRPVELTMYDTDGTEISVITADTGVYDETTGNMEARGSIVVIDRRDDRRLETEQLRYDAENDWLYGDAAFVLYSDAGLTVVRGAAFDSDPGLDSVRVRSPSGQSARKVRIVAAVPPDTTRDVGDSATVAPDSLTTAPPDTTAARP